MVTKFVGRPQQDESQLIALLGGDKPPYGMFEHRVEARVLHFYLSEPVGTPEKYIDLIHSLHSAGENDVIYIHLNTPGGNLDTGIQIINAIRSTEATVITSLEATAHSLGTIIFLSGHQFMVHDDCMMMFHNYSSGVFGKGHEQLAELEATKRWFDKLAKRVYYPFLSEAEIEKIIKGDDLWLDSDEIRERLTAMIEWQDQQSAAEDGAEQAPQEDKPKAPPKKTARAAK